MRIAESVHRLVNSPKTEELTLRLTSADCRGDELSSQVASALDDLVLRWQRDEPLGADADGPIPPPVLVTTPIPPDVLITFDKFSDLPVTFDSLLRALESVVPSDTDMIEVQNSGQPGAAGMPLMFCELRVALQGKRQRGSFHPAVAAQAQAESIAAAWLAGLSSHARFLLKGPKGKDVTVHPTAIPETIAAQRHSDYYATVSAVLGTAFRVVEFAFTGSYVSLIVGQLLDKSAATFDAKAAIDELTDALKHLEPVTRSALIRTGDDLAYTGVNAHGNRDVAFLLERNALSTINTRLLDETGIVDAEGVVFVDTPPPGIDPRWTQQPFGHLTRITTPDFDDWFTAPPTPDTIQAGRSALGALLKNTVWG